MSDFVGIFVPTKGVIDKMTPIFYLNIKKPKKMKRFIFALALAGIAGGATAQTTSDNSTFEAVPTSKYSVATNSFWSNWFLQVGFTWNAFYDNAEVGDGYKWSKRPWKGFRSAPGMTIALGKWFTPGLGLRTKLDGFWGKTVAPEYLNGGKEPNNNQFKYWMLNEQAIFNLSNLFCGYKENRIWNISVYAGSGIARNMSDNKYSMILSGGLLNTFRINKTMSAFVDVQLAYGGDVINDLTGASSGEHSSRLKNHDLVVSPQIGLSFNLGKNRFKPVPDVDAILAQHKAQMDDMNARLKNAEDENAKLKDELNNRPAEQPAQETTSEVSGAAYSVFFNINSARLNSHKDILNLQSVADFAKANNDVQVICDGYADSKTGSASYNQKLSQKRAQAVANKLIEMGVPSSQISVNGLGGVKDVTPFKYNRRVIVRVK